MQRKLILTLLSLFSFFVPLKKLAQATLPAATTVWEVQPTSGVDTNGGCFIQGASGTDLTYPTSSPVAYTDLVAVTTTTITSVAHAFSSTSPGNCLHIASGTGWTTGWFQIVSVAGATATVDRAIATMGSTGGTGTLGGAIKTLTQLNTNMTSSHTAWTKAETSITTAALTFNFTSTGAAAISGYTTTRGDMGQVTISMSANSATMVTLSVGNNQIIFRNFILDCNGHSACTGLLASNAGMTAEHVKVLTSTDRGFRANNVRFTCRWCFVTGFSGTAAFDQNANGEGICQVCVATGGTVAGFKDMPAECTVCIAANNTGATTDGFISTDSTYAKICDHCIAYKNGRDGIRYSNGTITYAFTVTNSIFEDNVGVGLDFTSLTIAFGGETLDYNAYYNSTGTARTGNTAGTHDVTLSATPFTAGGSNNFALNSTAGGGASVKAVGYPGVLDVGGTGYIDIGALQFQAPAANNGSASGFVQ